MGPKKGKKGKKAEEEVVEESGNSVTILPLTSSDGSLFLNLKYIYKLFYPLEYDTMDLEMLREVVPMLRQQLEKSMLDRNYVQLERVLLLFDKLIYDLHGLNIFCRMQFKTFTTYHNARWQR